MKRKHKRMSITALICWIVLLAGVFYIVHWYVSKLRIEQESREYQALYTPDETEAVQTNAAQTPLPSPEPTTVPELPSVDDHLRETEAPAVEPYIALLPTTPPIQDSFSQLLERNPDTIGYLTVGDIISLPVVWRENDNSTYLDHNFSGEVAPEGTLFLDGYNRLVPCDDCLIVYGHNMQNGTMFGSLHLFEQASTVRNCPLISFDTIYENGTYAPFAAFRASANSDFRKFAMGESEFNEYVGAMRGKSTFSVDLDVEYGDSLLLLVTCDYDEQDGRFVLALRKLRDSESADAVANIIRLAK